MPEVIKAERTPPSTTKAPLPSSESRSTVSEINAPEIDFCDDHIAFWRKLSSHTIAEVTPELTPQSPRVSPRKTLGPTTPPYIYCLYVAWCIPYVFLCRCPHAFFGFWLPFTFGSVYFAYTIFVGSWNWSVSFFALQCVLALPVWMIVTALVLPASTKFITERPRKKILVKPGAYYKKDGLMEQISSWLPQNSKDRWESGIDPESTPWIRSPDGQTMFPYIFGDLELGFYFIEIDYHRLWLEK